PQKGTKRLVRSPESDLQTGAQQQIILLQTGRRVRQITITKRHLPADAPRDVCNETAIKVDSIFAAARQVWKKEQLLRERQAWTKSMVECLTGLRFRRATIVEVTFEVLAVPCEPAEQI